MAIVIRQKSLSKARAEKLANMIPAQVQALQTANEQKDIMIEDLSVAVMELSAQLEILKAGV